MDSSPGLAFYDLDGTLVESNVVTQYRYYARGVPSGGEVVMRFAELLVKAPLLLGTELYSRRLFNEVFYRLYRGMRREWLEKNADGLFQEVFRPAILPGAKPLVEIDAAEGFRTVLVTGSPEFAIGPLVRHFGFDEVIANRLVFEDGVATGAIAPPVLAGQEKVDAIRDLCRRYNVEAARSKAYSDSMSDLPMLEAVGRPVATNPGRRLRQIAERRGWEIVRLQ